MEPFKYTNLEIEIAFVNEKSNKILNDIADVLKKYGYVQYTMEMGTDESGVYQIDKVNFLPKEALS